MSNRLEVKIDGNASGFKHAMDTVRTQAKGTADSISHSWTRGAMASLAGGIVGMFSFEGIKSSLDSFLHRASELREISEQLEMSAEATQKWQKAADELGLSMSGVENVLMSIQSMRQQALRDPKAADLFSAIGITRQQILNEDTSGFARDVLMAGSSSAENRKILEQIVGGKRGLKFAGAAKVFDKAEPDFQPEVLETAHQAEIAEKRAGGFAGRVFGYMMAGIMRSVDVFMGKKPEGNSNFYRPNPNSWYARHHPELFKNPPTDTSGGPVVASDAKADGAQKTEQNTEDPLKGVKSREQTEFDLQKNEAEMGLHASQRGNMTIAGRKKSIKADLVALTNEIAARQSAADFQNVYGMDFDQTAQLLPSDREKMLREDYLKLIGLRAKAQGLTNDLRDSRGFHSDADSLARVGLFSSSTISMNPMLQLSQKQINVLEKIEHNTSKHAPDPHRR